VGVREYAVSCSLFLCFIQIPSPTSLTHPLTPNQNTAKIVSNPFNVFLSSLFFSHQILSIPHKLQTSFPNVQARSHYLCSAYRQCG